jgi:hypothetical protein
MFLHDLLSTVLGAVHGILANVVTELHNVLIAI